MKKHFIDFKLVTFSNLRQTKIRLSAILKSKIFQNEFWERPYRKVSGLVYKLIEAVTLFKTSKFSEELANLT
jgi:hypothetical protein